MDPVANQLDLHFRMVKSCAYHTGSPMGKGRHGIEQMGCLPGACPISSGGGFIIRRGMAQRNGHAHFSRFLNEFHRAGLLRCNGHQLDHALGCVLQTAEHHRVRVMEKCFVLRTFFGFAQERTLQIHAHQLRAGMGGFVVRRGIGADFCQLVLAQSHTCRADVGHALAQLKICHCLQAVGGCVAEILAHAAMEMQVHQTGNHIAAGSVQYVPAVIGFHNLFTADEQVFFYKALVQIKYLTADYSHISSLFPPSFFRDSVSFSRAASSPTRTTSGCSCRMEAGHSGVMGPQNA